MEKYISIIIPTYKRDSLMLIRAIESILNQEYKNYEIIIIDDNDKDDNFYNETKLCEQKYKNKNNIRFYYQNINKGANSARNLGISKSKYSLLAFLDSDDEWNKDYLLLMVQKFNSPEIGLCYSGYNIITKNSVLTTNCNGLEGNIFDKEIILDRISPTSCVIIKKECVKETGEFDCNLPARQDFDMWVRITRKYKVASVHQPLVNVYRNGHESISSNYQKRIDGTIKVYTKILDSLTKNEKQKYYKKINWAMNKTIAEIYIQCKMYKNSEKYLLLSLKYHFNFKLFLKFLIIKLNLYDFLLKLAKKE